MSSLSVGEEEYEDMSVPVTDQEDETGSSDEHPESNSGKIVVEAVPTKEIAHDAAIKDTMFSQQARFVARKPWLCFGVAFIVAVALSVIGLIVGDFDVAADNAGWRTRGTLIADRHQQLTLVLFNRGRLFNEGDEAWDDLTNNVQDSREADDDDDVEERRLDSLQAAQPQPPAVGSSLPFQNKSFSMTGTRTTQRWLQDSVFAGGLDGCEVSWYASGAMHNESHLWPVWKTRGDSTSALDPQVIRDLCVAEEATQAAMLASDLCYGCGGDRCLPPYSLVFFARLTVQDTGFNMTCDELSAAFAESVDDVEAELQACVADLKESYKEGEVLPESCPFGFSPSLLDEGFSAENNVVRYTSSVFASSNDTEALYEKASEYDRADWSSLIEGAYDTRYEDFVYYTLDDSLTNDMILAMASAAIVAVAILVHTRSPWITLIGLLQIILSFPLAYFVYSLIAQLEFFPFLNFVGVFVVFALGAGDVFVAVDKWKNARLEHKSATTEDIAAIALPDAAGAMFLTTLTTAVAFFATAICKVAPLKAFAIFCGLLITFDYIMCVLLIFPALCIYDRTLIRGSRNCCISCHCCHRMEAQNEGVDGEESKPSCIRRVLTSYYNIVHKIRWGLLLACVAGFIVSAIYAASLTLPTTSDVRLLDESSQFELAYLWRVNILSEVLLKQGGSRGFVIWGVVPADTGHHLNPDTWTQLVLDESFDPSSEAAQEYLLGFCNELFANEFATKTDEDYVCPMNAFNLWLQEQSSSDSPSDAYLSNCSSATEIPVPQENFDSCIIAWSKLVTENHVLERAGKVRIMVNRFQSRVRYDSPFDDLRNEWNTIETWMNNQTVIAPPGVKAMFFSSEDFWWYDTNADILRAAYGAAAIALAAAALVILFSSRSFLLTLFAVFTIAFILTSVTAMLVAAGWTLGFLESICFAIAIGISCDFVIHFAHAYSMCPGDVSRSDRTQFALIRMGPSILAAAFTTICSAVVMVFTTISFFQKFAIILFFTILMATVGSFVVFITLADCIGPNRPTYLVDLMAAKMTKCSKSCCKRCKRRKKTRELMDSTDESDDVMASGSVVDGRRESLYSDLESMTQSSKDIAGHSSVEGRRESLYSDLESMAQSSKDIAGHSSVVEGPRESLYSDLDSLRHSTRGSSTSVVEGRRASLYSDLENF